jgi:hypothetical protein
MRHLASLAAFPAFAFAFAGAAAAQPAPDAGPPGVCECAAPPPTVVAAAPAPELPRWSVGLDLAGITLHPKDVADDQSHWGGGGLEVRFRPWPHWELGLGFDGAREQLADGTPGDRELRLATLSARYHLSPYARWDFYLLAGAGSAAIVPAGTTGDLPAGTSRGQGELGVGVERRFGHLGVAAELRVIGISPPDGAGGQTTTAAAGAPMEVTPPPPTMTDSGLDGGMFRISAGYSF